MDNSSVMAERGEHSSWIFPKIEPMGDMGEGGRRDVVEHRRQILEAARQLFAERGVEQVSMHQIAQRAHVGQGTLYRRFAHKGQLCMVLLGESIARFQSELLTYFEQAGERVSYFEQLNQMLVRLMHFTEENAALLNAMFDVGSGEGRMQAYQSPFYRWLQAVVRVLLWRGIERGQMPEMDVEYVVDVILAFLSVDFYHYQRHISGLGQERIAQGLRQFLVSGLGVEEEIVQINDKDL
jgi:AcrR family transcriptional regulator